MSKKSKEAKAQKREQVKKSVLAEMAENRIKIREYNKMNQYDKANELAAKNHKLWEMIS